MIHHLRVRLLALTPCCDSSPSYVTGVLAIFQQPTFLDGFPADTFKDSDRHAHTDLRTLPHSCPQPFLAGGLSEHSQVQGVSVQRPCSQGALQGRGPRWHQGAL